MKYQITHTTHYTYSAPVPVCHNVVMMTPRAQDRLECLQHQLTVQPHPTRLAMRTDRFGNTLHEFSLMENHDALLITAHSIVQVHPTVDPAVEGPDWETVRDTLEHGADPGWFEACAYRFASTHVPRSDEFAKYAAEAFSPGRGILAAVRALNHQIHREFFYDPQSTQVDTPTIDVLRMRRGVCQDLAHVGIACLRSLGIPARYVSGYIRTTDLPGKEHLVGADQSHAWLSAYCGPWGWLDWDPTNNCRCDTDHVPVAWGRDYRDVAPVRGVFLGGGRHHLQVQVRMQPLDPISPAPP